MTLTNSGDSGPGIGGAISLSDTLYSKTTAIPNLKFKVDSAIAGDPKPIPAIPTGSGNSWYSYTPGVGVAPTLRHAIIVKTADGKFAKYAITNYEYSETLGRYYTFKYIYQPNKDSNRLDGVQPK